MLTRENYCDYVTSVALKELGYKIPTSAYYMPNHEQLIFVSNPLRGGIVKDCFRSHNSYGKNVMSSEFIDAPTLWEAQKWLREEKGIHVEVYFAELCNKQPLFEWVIVKEYDYSISNLLLSKEKYFSSEEALSEGVKCAVKILKEDETIHG